jgi:uncharacterized membrane protein
MKSKFAIAGHPLHPLLVALPIGLFVWTLIADIVYLATSHIPMWYDIAFWTGFAAWITALVAALPGFGDFFTMAIHTDARPIAITHMLLNLATVALFFVAWLLMLNNGAVDGPRLTAMFVLHIVGVGFLTLSGWLGGEMVFRHHLATIPEDAEMEQAEHVRHDLGTQHVH